MTCLTSEGVALKTKQLLEGIQKNLLVEEYF